MRQCRLNWSKSPYVKKKKSVMHPFKAPSYLLLHLVGKLNILWVTCKRVIRKSTQLQGCVAQTLVKRKRLDDPVKQSCCGKPESVNMKYRNWPLKKMESQSAVTRMPIQFFSSILNKRPFLSLNARTHTHEREHTGITQTNDNVRLARWPHEGPPVQPF